MNIKERFTRWYIKKGYTFDYGFKETGKYEFEMEMHFDCPRWVKPLCVFFSPSVYLHDVTMPRFREGLRQALGLERVKGE